MSVSWRNLPFWLSDSKHRRRLHRIAQGLPAGAENLDEAKSEMVEPAQGLATTDRRDWLVGGGEMGKLVRSMDWSKTPLGALEDWPQSLRTTVSLCLASVSPFSIIWGSEHIQIYNDGYWPICGTKHPKAMGQDYRECWASAWPAISGGFEAALRGETQYFENQWMYLDRYGYLEETCFTFSFSPIRDESGGIGGLLHPVTEVTPALISERRLRVVRDVIAGASGAQTLESAITLCIRVLAGFNLDVPFGMVYRVDSSRTEARLLARTVALADDLAPDAILLDGLDATAWPLGEVIASNRIVEVDDLAARFGAFECNPYPEPPRKALLLPISLPGANCPICVLIVGTSARLPFNDAYRGFYELLAGAVSSAVTSAVSYEEERKRAEKLAEIDRAKTEFFSNVSHEFRTPLTLILGPVEDELAERVDPLPAGRRERLETVHRNSMRLLKLVNSLLDFSRIEAGRTEARFEATDLAAYTTELTSSFRSAVERGGLSLVVECPPLPEPVYVDRSMWEKIVLNLLSNAFKHTFEGSISVRLRWLGNEVELAIQDTGIGIAASELPLIFERFRRVQHARSRSHEGTGIGLALVGELIQAHGGMIRAESEAGRGSTFRVTVKTDRAHLAAELVDDGSRQGQGADRLAGIEVMAHTQEALRWIANERASAGAADLEQAELGSDAGTLAPRILWADDNSDMRGYVERLLSEKYRVIAVADGLAALKEARENPPDLILSDVMMPGLDGFGLLEAIRSEDSTRMIPMILLSARAGEEASLEGIAAGADDYLMKPFSARELMARIGTQLRAAKVRSEWAAMLERREQQLVVTADELRRSNEELAQFAHVASHDLQEPLRTVASFVQLLAKRYQGRLDKDADEFISFAVDGCKRMKHLIQDMLAYSRSGLDAGDMRVVASGDALQVALTNLRGSIEESKAIVSAAELPTIRSNESQLVQIFQNLISNAIKYRRVATPTIHVAAEKSSSSEWIFSVKDNGLGIEPAFFQKIFVLFQRVNPESIAAGTGMGLAICKKMIERLGGRIWVESEMGVGSTFYFAVPAEMPAVD